MDMGYPGELEFFFQKVQENSGYGKITKYYIASALVTLKAAQALTTGETQTIKFSA